MNVNISDHALKMMAERGISEKEIRDFFNEKIKVVSSNQSRRDPDCVELEYQRLDKKVKVVYAIVTNTVVTVYPRRK